MLKWSLCDYSDAHILVKRRITITREEQTKQQEKQVNKGVIKV